MKNRTVHHLVFCLLGMAVSLPVSGQPVLAEETHEHEKSTDEYQFRPLVTFPGVKGQGIVRYLHHERTLTVLFSPELDPGTFKATLNGTNVAEHFQSIDEGIATVELPFVAGENRLEIEVSPKRASVNGVLSSLTQVHRLTISYQPLQAKMGVFSGAIQLTEEERNLPPEQLMKRLLEERKN